MRLSAILFALLFGLAVLTTPAAAEDKADDYDQETIDWLNSWGIKRNPDGSLQSMTEVELEEYWRSREVNEEERQQRKEKLEALMKEQIEHDEELVRNNPNDPDVHYQVALNNQGRGDGEGAIIHMIKAEQLYRVAKDIRGLARSRKALREYFQTYGYLPEDFDLNH
jgi:hypothetical protein